MPTHCKTHRLPIASSQSSACTCMYLDEGAVVRGNRYRGKLVHLPSTLEEEEEAKVQD